MQCKPNPCNTTIQYHVLPYMLQTQCNLAVAFNHIIDKSKVKRIYANVFFADRPLQRIPQTELPHNHLAPMAAMAPMAADSVTYDVTLPPSITSSTESKTGGSRAYQS